uniref:Uncharacterized protein n=1 Tax=Rhizophora mucronata TaxID=61149 RepID=A0A2P2MI02_RHIMU
MAPMSHLDLLYLLQQDIKISAKFICNVFTATNSQITTRDQKLRDVFKIKQKTLQQSTIYSLKI